MNGGEKVGAASCAPRFCPFSGRQFWKQLFADDTCMCAGRGVILSSGITMSDETLLHATLPQVLHPLSPRAKTPKHSASRLCLVWNRVSLSSFWPAAPWGMSFPWLQLFCIISRDTIFLQGRSMLYTEGWSLGQLCTLPLNSVGKIPMSKSELGRKKALLKCEREGKSPAVVLSCLQRVSAFGAFYISAKPELSRKSWVWASFPADASNI